MTNMIDLSNLSKDLMLYISSKLQQDITLTKLEIKFVCECLELYNCLSINKDRAISVINQAAIEIEKNL